MIRCPVCNRKLKLLLGNLTLLSPEYIKYFQCDNQIDHVFRMWNKKEYQIDLHIKTNDPSKNIVYYIASFKNKSDEMTCINVSTESYLDNYLYYKEEFLPNRKEALKLLKRIIKLRSFL